MMQEELDTAHQSAEELNKQRYSLKAELVDCKQAAAAHAASAATKLAETQVQLSLLVRPFHIARYFRS